MRLFALGIVLMLRLIAVRAKADGTCGERKTVVQSSISNRYKALAGAWPWYGAMFHRIRYSSAYACGVTILTDKFVITAAHCTIDQYNRQRIPAERAFIKVGVTDLDVPDRHVQQLNIDRTIRHEGYNVGTFKDDIALLKLKTFITFNEYVQPICQWQGATKLDNIVSKIGYLVGWGRDENFRSVKKLNEATMPIVSKKECIDSDPNHYLKFYFESRTFCAGYRNGTQEASGDGGGGLFLRIGQHWALRGIVSYIILNPETLKVDPNSFVVFTDASYYIDWIKSHVSIPEYPQDSSGNLAEPGTIEFF